ncbi:unnamed protein product [Eruca vesicaria subsp. sativa]|uniref:Uncharacterized protein n=1 Tax=Eruca vesicaria subsp. sativa TaxID=29727 RepID=A0ABC8JFX2_ERUVS|nr:unnamed protein product [Eruca vesicaria subsp. sativa]
MDPWSWICELPESHDFSESDTHAVFQLGGDLTRSIQLRVERDSSSDLESLSLTFKVMAEGFSHLKSSAIWVSNTCVLSSEKPFLPLVLQLLQELISYSPTTDESTCTKSELLKIKPGPVNWVMDSHSPESFSSVFNLILITRLFWLCVFDAPSEVGSFFFQHLLGSQVESLTCQHAPVLRTFLVSVGVDAELCIVRAASYVISKWMISKEVGLGNLGLKQITSPLPHQSFGFSYATEAHGLWSLKGYFPILSMNLANNNKIIKFRIVEPKEAVLRYALSHQHAEVIVQFEYSVTFHENYIKVNARVDNIRIHVSNLGFNKRRGMENQIADCYTEEKYFPSRVQVWVGPEIGSNHVSALSLGWSTKNEEREIEVMRVLKGKFWKGKGKVAPRVKARARMSTRRKIKDWRTEQESEGNAAVFDAVLYDRESGQEVMTVKPSQEGLKNVFTKSRGMVFGRDEYGDGAEWRVGREMEGSVLKWRMGGKIWLTYWPNKLCTSFYETRCVEWCDEVDLPLVPTT